MKLGWLMALISANLLVLVVLVFAYPNLMVGPGPVVAAHAEITTDCFACHAPWRGASAARCVSCHVLADIGLRTSKGVAIVQPTRKTAFHQALIEQDCMACHSDHAAPRLTQRSRKPFSHVLLKTAVREQCQSCHQAPTDKLHVQITGNCNQCHSQQAWKPATFEHDKLFLLDRDHAASCETCHRNNDYRRYTCYGCHEHSLDKIRSEHREEGIQNFENCVECHRSAEEDPKSRGSGQRKDKEDDD